MVNKQISKLMIDLMSDKKVLSIKKGEYLYKRDDSVDGIYLVEDGLFNINNTCDNLGSFLYCQAKDGDLIGIHTHFGGEKTSRYSVLAAADSTYYFVSNNEFDDMILKSKEFGKTILQLTCKRIDDVQTRLVSMQKCVKSRLADLILHEMNSDKEFIYNINDLARMNGTTLSYVRRVLKFFSNQNIITKRKGYLKVINKEDLILVSEEG